MRACVRACVRARASVLLRTPPCARASLYARADLCARVYVRARMRARAREGAARPYMQPPGAFGLMYGSGWRRSHSRRSPSAMSRSMRSGSWTWRYCSNAARHFSAYARACVCVCVRMAARVRACARACAAWHLGLGNGAAACEAQVRAQGARAPHVEACRPDGRATAVARTRVPGRVRLTATARHDAARAPRANSTRTEKGGDTPRHIRARAHRRRCAHVHSCMCTCTRTCASPRARSGGPKREPPIIAVRWRNPCAPRKSIYIWIPSYRIRDCVI